MLKRKLLLADDSITIQKVVNLTFADEGIEVISVGDGDSAMHKFEEFMPDLVMADVNMPGLTGYEICQIIKQNDDTRGIPVILLVGSFEPFDEAEAARVGADDFLTKPFQSIRQLVNKVTDLLNQSRQAQVSKETQTAPETAPPVSSFDNTIEFEKHEEVQTEFGDAGMDDEMIETSPANDYVFESNAVYQAETTIDYAKTQPLSADDLKGFSIVPPSVQSETETQEETPQYREETPQYQDISAEQMNRETVQFSEPPNFDEEARKLEESSPLNDALTEEIWQKERSEQSLENESFSEPQVDYYLPPVESFDKELTTAETLEPEVSYSTEEPRTADFSQMSSEESNETAEVAYTIEEKEPETSSEPQFSYQSEAPVSYQSLSETEKVEEVAQTETSFVEEPETIAAEEPETIQSEESETILPEESEPEAAENLETFAPEVVEESVPETVQEPATYFTEIPETKDLAEDQPIAENESIAVTPMPEMEIEPLVETLISSTVNAPSFNFDDDLLELPPLVEETGIRPQPQIQQVVAEPEPVAETVAETVEEPVAATQPAETQTVAEVPNFHSFPPELIEAIAQKVAEKISGKAIQDIAWEVVPQMTELIIKKMAEEKLKEEK